MSDQSKQPTDAVAKALLAILEAIEAQAPVITNNGMVNVWLDANLLKHGRAVLKNKDGR